MDPVNSEFFKGLSENRLLIQKCSKCGNLQFYPKPICVNCSSVELGWVESSGEGTIYSLTSINRVIMNSKEFNDEVPYTIASIELKEGVRLYGRINNEGNKEASIGDKVKSVPVQVNQDVGLPTFELL
ncbi:hypothetical protein IX51_03010 [uncultured archaeon]|nr:hypothetical protein IX51_03010 [uncultured archaeon]